MARRRPALTYLVIAVFLMALLGAVVVAVIVDRASAATAGSGWRVTAVREYAAGAGSLKSGLAGDYVAYVGLSGGIHHGEVFLYRISTGATTQIKTTSDHVSELRNDGRYVAWLTSAGVWVYDMLSGGSAKLVDPTAGSDLCLRSGRLAWSGADGDIHVFNIPASTGYSLGHQAESGLDLNGDYLVWVELVASGQSPGFPQTDAEVMLHDLSSGQTANISGLSVVGGTIFGGRDHEPQVATNGFAVWTHDYVTGSSEVWGYNAKPRFPELAFQVSYFPPQGSVYVARHHHSPLTDGRWVVWNELGDLWLCDTQAAEPAATNQLIVGNGDGTGGVYEMHKAIGGGWLVYYSEPNVWLYDCSTGTSEMVGSVAPEDLYGLQTDGQRIVAEVGSDTHCAVLLFERGSSGTTTTTAPATTTTTVPGGGQRFRDVPSSHPYHQSINGMADLGIIEGYDGGEFRPSNPVTRQQFAKMIVGTLGFPCSEADVCPFTDVVKGGPTTLYPDNFIAVAANYNITKGIGGSNFGPYRDITRAQVITMVVRAAQGYTNGLQTPDASYSQGRFGGFNDPNHGYNVQLAEFNGLLNGLQGSGDPGTWIWGNATRGEVAQILWNLSGVPGSAG